MRSFRNPLCIIVALSALLTGGAGAWAQMEAISNARHDLKLGFTVPGMVQKVLVEPGAQVKENDVLIELEDQEGEALLAIHKARANSDLAVRAAEKEFELTKVEYKALKQAFDQGAGTPIEVERAQVRMDIAELELSLAKLQLKEAQGQLEQAQARHNKYYLRAPVDGFVDSVLIREGEIVEQLKPVLRLVVTNPLRADVFVPTSQTLELEVGDPAWVQFQLEDQAQQVQGSVIHMAGVADGASNTRLVRVEFPNPQNVPAGVHVSVHFSPPDEVAQAPEVSQ